MGVGRVIGVAYDDVAANNDRTVLLFIFIFHRAAWNADAI